MSSLASIFFSTAPRVGKLVSPSELETRLQSSFEEARARWPRVKLEPPDFARHWAHKAALLADPAGWGELHAVDLYLALACSRADAAAVDHLRGELMPKMLATLRHVDASDTFVHERAQELFERVLVAEPGKPARIAEFNGQGPLEHWLKASALRLALNARRAQKRSPEVPANEEGLLDVAGPAWDPSAELLRRRYGAELSAALKRALQRLGTQDRNLLQLHFVKGLSLNQVGAMYQVNKSTVSRWLTRARQSLLEDARTDLAGKLALPAAELESLWSALGPQLDLSLSGVLKSQREETGN